MSDSMQLSGPASMEAQTFGDRVDTLVALSIVFAKKRSRKLVESGERSITEIVRTSLCALDSPKLEKAVRRASEIESLPESERQLWLARSIDDVRRRGRPKRLDHNIHVEQVVRVLKLEPFPIRRVILNYLPFELRRDVERDFDPGPDGHPEDSSLTSDLPAEVVEVIKRRFLANFVQYESVCDGNAVDELSADELPRFIRSLGLREIAVACRGINSKEKIAGFLSLFSEEDAREIATYLSGLDDIEPILVATADRTVQRLWNRRLRPDQIVYKIGSELLASTFSERNTTAVYYTAQKLPYRDSERWKKAVRTSRVRMSDPDLRTVEVERNRAWMIVQMAGQFKEVGTL